MTPRPSVLLRLAATAALAVSLASCVSLLPKQKPATLYSFGGRAGAVEAAAPAPARVGVYRAGGQFQREAAGDRILTITGQKAAYIAEARWVAPAEVLFEEAVTRAFESAAGRVRLVARGEPGRADYALRLDVRNFETRYGRPGAAPTVVVRVHAVVVRQAQAGPVSERIFEASAPAGENRVSAIVAAYDAAIGEVLGELTPWVEAQAG